VVEQKRAAELGGLHDVRRPTGEVLGAARGDRFDRRLVVYALVDPDDTPVLLGGVEARHEPLELGAARAVHRMPDANIRRLRRCGAQEKEEKDRAAEHAARSI
jgi:hypothetical protein